jgi:FAD/FMN-containing dehydrogenase
VNPNSLSIWTHNLKSIEWFETSFTPKGCKHSIDGTAMRVGSGGQWRDLNAAAKKRKVVLVSGEFDTVSVGGFLANGGHGGLSAK